jgi:hypothetical protein
MPAPEWVKGRLQPEPAVSKFIYNTFFKRSSSYMASIIVFSLGFGIAYDKIMNTVWDMNNKGVRAAAAHRPRCRRAEPRAPALPLAETMEGHRPPLSECAPAPLARRAMPRAPATPATPATPALAAAAHARR